METSLEFVMLLYIDASLYFPCLTPLSQNIFFFKEASPAKRPDLSITTQGTSFQSTNTAQDGSNVISPTISGSQIRDINYYISVGSKGGGKLPQTSESLNWIHKVQRTIWCWEILHTSQIFLSLSLFLVPDEETSPHSEGNNTLYRPSKLCFFF